MVGRWSWYWAHMYYTSYSMYVEPHKLFQTIIQLCQSLVHTYSNPYLPSFNTSYINAHPRAAPAGDFYVYTVALVSIWAYLDDNSML